MYWWPQTRHRVDSRPLCLLTPCSPLPPSSLIGPQGRAGFSVMRTVSAHACLWPASFSQLKRQPPSSESMQPSVSGRAPRVGLRRLRPASPFATHRAAAQLLEPSGQAAAAQV